MSGPESDAEGETITLYELLERSARAALELQREDGSFPPGRNGVYDEPETPVRTTSHWLTTLSKVYEITGDEVFADAANDAADYLLSDEARPHGYTYHSRNVNGKDKCDGLVGQAAPIRGLVRGGEALGRPALVEAGKEVFKCHPFDADMGLWERVEIDGTRLSFDRTLNHQLTFAAASTTLVDHGIGIKPIENFLDRLEKITRFHQDGVIKHYIRPPIPDMLWTVIRSPSYWNLLVNEIVFHYYSLSSKRRRKELGYHPVNLRGLARLKEAFPDHSIWESPLVHSAIGVVDSKTYYGPDGVQATSYGSMTPGMHTAYALWVLDDCKRTEIHDWITEDIERLFNFDENLLIKNTDDVNFQAAAIYNATVLPEITLEFSA